MKPIKLQNLFVIILLFATMPVVYSQGADDLETKAKEHMANGDYAAALDHYKQAIALIGDEPEHSTTFAYAGICAQNVNDLALAKSYYIASVERGIEDPMVFDALGTICKNEKDYDNQIMAYQAGADRLPEDRQKYLVKICGIYRKQKDAEKLLATAEIILADDPINEKGLEYKGTALQYQKRMSDAEDVFKDLYALSPDNINANIFLGNYYYQVGKGQLAKARKNYDAIAKPDRVQWHNHNEESKLTMEKYYRPAISHLETVYALKPSESLKKMLFVMYTKLGETDSAALYAAE